MDDETRDNKIDSMKLTIARFPYPVTILVVERAWQTHSVQNSRFASEGTLKRRCKVIDIYNANNMISSVWFI